MDMKLKGARVIVTAGAGGIGHAITLALRIEGARVAVCDIDGSALANLPGDVFSRRVDVTDRVALIAFMDAAVDALGGLDCLVNNAGVAGPTGAIEDLNPADVEHCLSVCLMSQFATAARAVPHLRKSMNASIVNISSLAGRLGFRLRTPYAAAKWGVVGLTKSLAMELGPDNIRVNAVLPGLVAGERQRHVLQARANARAIPYEAAEQEAFRFTSLPGYVTADQIADQVVFLASPRGRAISGQALSVCGDTGMLG
ncbi:MAG: SDR family oxidoreductase [Rhodobacteraceae bacterium]|nr:SDR family oxidoreductase [Paracoccaceae bacterium]